MTTPSTDTDTHVHQHTHARTHAPVARVNNCLSCREASLGNIINKEYGLRTLTLLFLMF